MIQLQPISSQNNTINNNISASHNKGRKKSEIKTAYWEGTINNWIDSGLTKKLFCERHKISFSALSYWRNRLSKKSSYTDQRKIKRIHNNQHGKHVDEKPKLAFSQLTVALPETASLSVSSIEIVTPNEYKVRLPVSLEVAVLKNILTMLGVCHAQSI